MIQIYSTVCYQTLKKLNSQASITETYHEGKPLPFGTFGDESFLHMSIFLTNLNLFGLAHTKFLIDYPMLHTNFSPKMVLHYTFTETI